MSAISPGKVLTMVGATMVALTAIGARLNFPGEIKAGDGATLRIFLALACVAGLLYLVAVAIVLRGRLPRRALWGILLVAALMRLLVLPTAPALSSDIYRYVWDGRVQGAGINPYRYVPQAPELTFLRDDTIYPNINRAGYARTIYPPVAESIFFLVAQVSSTVLAMKAAMVVFELLAIGIVIKLLDSAALPRERVLIYAWNPLAVWEFAGNGHVDAAAIGLIALALFARLRGRMILTGAALGAAALVKFFPAVLFPVLWRRWDLRMPAAFAVTIVAFYLFFISVGWRVLGFLPGYLSEEGLKTGSGFYYLFVLDKFAGAPSVGFYLAVVAITLGGLSCWMVFSHARPANPQTETLVVNRDALILATALTVAMTPHYAWYFAWLALPACVAPSYSILYLTLASFLLYLDPRHTMLLWRGLIYGSFLVFALTELWWRRRNGANLALAPLQRTSL